MGLRVPPPPPIDGATNDHVECGYCGRTRNAGIHECPSCGSVEIKQGYVPELLEVTCMGDTERRYIDTKTGKIITGRWR